MDQAYLAKMLEQLATNDKTMVAAIAIVGVLFILKLVFDFLKSQKRDKVDESHRTSDREDSRATLSEIYNPIQEAVKTLGIKVDNLTGKTIEIGVHLNLLATDIKDNKVSLVTSEAKLDEKVEKYRGEYVERLGSLELAIAGCSVCSKSRTAKAKK